MKSNRKFLLHWTSKHFQITQLGNCLVGKNIVFNVRQKKCKFFHSFGFIKYVIFYSVKKSKSAIAVNFCTHFALKKVP
jgi:hypothetical protein